MGLLQDDVEVADMLADAVNVLTSPQKLCDLMAETLVWLDVSDPVALWHHFLCTMDKHTPSLSAADLFALVGDSLSLYSLSLQQFGITPPHDCAVKSEPSRAAKEYAAELRVGSQLDEEKALAESFTLNGDQAHVFKAVMALLGNPHSIGHSNVIFVDGPAGTGKTFLYRKVLHHVRSLGLIALAVSMSGIAALLLPGGRTAHSRFRLPVPVPLEGCTCNVKSQSVPDVCIMIALAANLEGSKCCQQNVEFYSPTRSK